MHRIRGKPGAQPFFLQHGLVDSSAGYVIMGPNVSLGKFSPFVSLFICLCCFLWKLRAKKCTRTEKCLKNEFNA